MPLTDVPPIEASIDINASPARVWEIIGDPRAMAKYSPQTWRTFVIGGAVAQGSKMFNINHKGFLVWPTRAKVVVFEPGREIAWRVLDNYTVWRLRIEPTEGGCRLLQTREAPEGISDISVKLTDLALGGQKDFTAALKAGMERTLAGIKADAEA